MHIYIYKHSYIYIYEYYTHMYSTYTRETYTMWYAFTIACDSIEADFPVCVISQQTLNLKP